jgi:IclR family KDG regulon transcriptional repressor
MSKRTYSIGSVEAALDVIESFLSVDSETQSLAEISRRLNLNKSRVFRILNNLARYGYVDQDPQTQEYGLGMKLLVLGAKVRNRLNLGETANPFLVKLAEECGDAVHLLVLVGDRAYCIARRQGHHRLQAATPIGEPLPLHIGASPKLLLAYLPQPQRDQIIDEMELIPYTPNTITDQDELRQHLAQIRARGYTIDEEDFELGVCAIGAPVRDQTGRVIAGITITTPRSRYDQERRKRLIELVVATAQQLSEKLGYLPIDTQGAGTAEVADSIGRNSNDKQ